MTKRRARVLMTTEGTYPYILGGVSTWCDILVNGLVDVDWQILPITAGGLHRTPRFKIPSNVALIGHLDLWSETVHPFNPFRGSRRDRLDVPGQLVRGLLGWDSDPKQVADTFVWCRKNASRIRPIFRSKAGWQSFLAGLDDVLSERSEETAAAPDLDVLQASELYQTLYWAARTAAADTGTAPDAPDIVLVTAAGWSGLPAVVHKALHGTPIVLTEHGVYVREAYLATIRSGGTPSTRWVASRLARGLARVTYDAADVVAPVTQANAAWEEAMGVDAKRIRPIYNGVLVPTDVPPLPHAKRVVSIGRLDGLKDLKTMLRTAAAVLVDEPGATFFHFGPVPEGQEQYAEQCYALHRSLGLGERFRFMGPTPEPYEELAKVDVSLLTSISEGFSISVLEAMACGRPVVATSVGGVPEAVAGCGFVNAPGDAAGLARSVITLLRDDRLARTLGQRGRARVARNFGQAACLEAYAALFSELGTVPVQPPPFPPEFPDDEGAPAEAAAQTAAAQP